MGDYIKREDAIEIIARHDDTDGTIKVFSGRFVNGLISAIPHADVVEVVRCKDCVYYDPPHVEDHGKRLEYKDLPKEAFDDLGTGLVSLEYGINVGGRCYRDYNAGYSEDKRIYVSESNYCGRAERTDK